MKLHRESNILLSNTGNGSKFGMKSSAKAFAILSGLYIHKPRAIIRELGCNAFDSHKMAGKADVPFEVTLPTRLEPWLTIEDFGVGLDKEEIESVYTVYFESTKTDSNDEDGALGLGSKAPFAYTDQFVVVATKHGLRHTYQMLIDETGQPDYVCLSTVETDEPNGVRIQIPINHSDIWEFNREAASVYKWFEVPPIINNGEQIKRIDRGVEMFELGDYITVDSGWGGDCAELNSSVYALMGNVLYAIDTKDLRDDDGKYVLGHNSPAISHLLSKSKTLILQFNRGDLDFLPSRESLSFDKRTKATVISAAKLLEASLKQRTQDRITACETFDDLADLGLYDDPLFDFFASSIKYRGEPILDWVLDLKNITSTAQLIGGETARVARRMATGVQRITRPRVDTKMVEWNYSAIKPWIVRDIHILVTTSKRYRKFQRGWVFDQSRKKKGSIAYETTAEYLDDFVGMFEDYNVIIHHQDQLIADGIKPEPKVRSASSSNRPQLRGHEVVLREAGRKKEKDRYSMVEIRSLIDTAIELGHRVTVLPMSNAYGAREIHREGETVISLPLPIYRKVCDIEGVLNETTYRFTKKGLRAVIVDAYRSAARVELHNTMLDENVLAIFKEISGDICDIKRISQISRIKKIGFSVTNDRLFVLQKYLPHSVVGIGIGDAFYKDMESLRRFSGEFNDRFERVLEEYPLLSFSSIRWGSEEYINDAIEYIRSKRVDNNITA